MNVVGYKGFDSFLDAYKHKGFYMNVVGYKEILAKEGERYFGVLYERSGI